MREVVVVYHVVCNTCTILASIMSAKLIKPITYHNHYTIYSVDARCRFDARSMLTVPLPRMVSSVIPLGSFDDV